MSRGISPFDMLFIGDVYSIIVLSARQDLMKMSCHTLFEAAPCCPVLLPTSLENGS